MNVPPVRSTSAGGYPRPIKLVLALLWLGTLVPSAVSAARASGPVPVAVSIHPLALLVKEIGGDDVAVTTLLSPGASPHGFEPTPGQVKKLAGAAVLITVGSGLDPWADRLARGLSADTARLVLTGGEAGEHGARNAHDTHTGHDAHGDPHGDPHVWLDPIHVRDQLVPMITRALSQADPSRATAYRERATDFSKRLSVLDTEIATTLHPLQGLVFVAFHGPWGRFSARYGLRQVAVVEPAPGREPSARWMRQIIETARREGARAVIIEPQFNPRIARTIAGQFGGRVVLADPLGTAAQSYFELMRLNLNAFHTAFSHEVSP